MPFSANSDSELRDWLRFESDYGSNFMRAVAEAALIADAPSYILLLPALIELKNRSALSRPKARGS